MNIFSSIKWMFFGSLLIGIFLNGMNMLAYHLDHLYISKTLIYSALLMASNMSILEILMYYSHSGDMKVKLMIMFIIVSILMIIFLRKQYLIGDKDWLKRMISHHSTALTTSHQIKKKTKNNKIKKLANDIIKAQEREIKLMKQLLQ